MNGLRAETVRVPETTLRTPGPTPLDPNIILRRPVAAFMPGIHHPARLEQQYLHFALRKGLVLHALGDHEHLARTERNSTLAKVDPQTTLDHKEGFVSFPVIVPNKVALQFHDLELVI